MKSERKIWKNTKLFFICQGTTFFPFLFSSIICKYPWENIFFLRLRGVGRMNDIHVKIAPATKAAGSILIEWIQSVTISPLLLITFAWSFIFPHLSRAINTFFLACVYSFNLLLCLRITFIANFEETRYDIGLQRSLNCCIGFPSCVFSAIFSDKRGWMELVNWFILIAMDENIYRARQKSDPMTIKMGN